MFDVTANKGKGNEREKKAHTDEWFANMFGPSTYTHTHVYTANKQALSRTQTRTSHDREKCTATKCANDTKLLNYSK